MTEGVLQFGGFEYPQANFTRIPNAFLEAMSIIDTVGEMKVVYYILRHTWGFQDDSKKITLDEFQHGRKRRDGSRMDNGTGLAKSTIIDGLGRAEEHGFIEVDVDISDKARIKKYYSLCMKSDVRSSDIGSTEVIHPGPEVIQRTEKETPQKKCKKVPTPTESEHPQVNVSRLLRKTMTKAEDEEEPSQLAAYIGQQFNSVVPSGQRTKLAMGYTEQLPGGKKRKHPSPDELWLEHPLFPTYVEERVGYIKGKAGGSNAQQRARAVNAICQYKGNHFAWLEWLEREGGNYKVPEEGTFVASDGRVFRHVDTVG